jgi:hypothetical protein
MLGTEKVSVEIDSDLFEAYEEILAKERTKDPISIYEDLYYLMSGRSKEEGEGEEEEEAEA